MTPINSKTSKKNYKKKQQDLHNEKAIIIQQNLENVELMYTILSSTPMYVKRKHEKKATKRQKMKANNEGKTRKESQGNKIEMSRRPNKQLYRPTYPMGRYAKKQVLN